MKDKYDDVRKKIRVILAAYNIKQADIARDLGISPQAVNSVVTVRLRGGKPLKNSKVFWWLKQKIGKDIEKMIDEVTA